MMRDGAELAADHRRDDRPRPRRPHARHRRPVRRDEGAAGRLLRASTASRSTTRSRRPASCRPRGTARSRCGHWWSGSEPDAAAAAFREHWGRAVAALVRRFGDPDLAEESVQEAFAGAPPGGRSTACRARRRLDRRDGGQRRHRPPPARAGAARASCRSSQRSRAPSPTPTSDEQDRRARRPTRADLHLLPSGARDRGQVALTLRLVAGLDDAEIARAFLVPEPSMAQRLVRAKREDPRRRHPLRVPPSRTAAGAARPGAGGAVPGLQRGVLGIVRRALVRRDLCDEAIRLARLLVSLLPGEPEPRGLLALMLFHHARAAARTTAGGELVLLEDQDRGRWDARHDRPGLGRAAPRRSGRLGRAVRAPGRDRREHARAAHGRGDRLARDRRPVRAAGRGRAVAGRRAQPGRGGLDGRRARRAGLVLVDVLAAGRARPLPPPARRPGGHAAPARPHGRGARRVPPRARARARASRPGVPGAAGPRCSARRASTPPNLGQTPSGGSGSVSILPQWRARSRLWAGSWAPRRSTRWPTARSRARSTTRSASPRSTRSR